MQLDWLFGSTLYEPGVPLDFAYFPATASVSVEHLMADGASAETAIVGCEGLVGIASFMGGESRPNRAVVQTDGWAYRLRGHLLNREFNRGGPLQELLLRYTMALIAQTAQTGICNRHHSVDQQLCRWLLLSLDRSASSELTATHEQIAHLLGVRREGVTEAAGNAAGELPDQPDPAAAILVQVHLVGCEQAVHLEIRRRVRRPQLREVLVSKISVEWIATGEIADIGHVASR